MKNPKTDTSEADIVKVLRDVDGDPSSFEALISTWNSVFEQKGADAADTFEGVEKAAVSSVASMTEIAPNSSLGRQVGQLLETFASPAYMVRENGAIIAQNTAAVRTYNLDASETLANLPFALEQDEPIDDVIRASLDPRRNLHDAVLKRAYSPDDDSTVTLSIAPSKPIVAGSGEALVFVIDTRWKTEAAGLIKREFDLTDAERELLEGFLDGRSTQDMAKTRGRSHATVRTQFYSLMSKMGARTQTELFRNALSISQFVDKIDEISEVLRHPNRKRVDVLRPGGRSVEVTLSGDMTGKPIVFLQNCTAYTFERHIEQAFKDAGLCLLSICRPGYGDTDPALAGDTYYGTFAGDITALLDQLGHDTCILMSTNTSSAVMYAIAPHVASRTVGLVQVAAAAPVSYMVEGNSPVPWVKAILRTSKSYPGLKDFMIKSGLRAWCALGQRRYLRTQTASDPVEVEIVSRPETLLEYQNALDIATKQGYEAAIHDTSAVFSDFKADVSATDLPILLIHGVREIVFDIEPIRNFARDFADRMTFIELPDGRFSAMTTHTDEIVGHIASFYAGLSQD